MSQTNITYPQAIDRDPFLWQVREDDDNYGNENLSRSILELINHIIDRLVRADALAEIIQTAENPPEHATRITAMLLQDLIRETQMANEKLWEMVHKIIEQQGIDKPPLH